MFILFCFKLTVNNNTRYFCCLTVDDDLCFAFAFHRISDYNVCAMKWFVIVGLRQILFFILFLDDLVKRFYSWVFQYAFPYQVCCFMTLWVEAVFKCNTCYHLLAFILLLIASLTDLQVWLTAYWITSE